MRLAIMQPYLFPYIGYFQLMNAADKFIIYDDVNFINKGWINRNQILLNGKAHLFSVPLKSASQNKLINTIAVSRDVRWEDRLLKTIERSYKKAPYFGAVYPMIGHVLTSGEPLIKGLILRSIELINKYLDITTAIVPSSGVYHNNHLKGQERIIDICRCEETTEYINAIGGLKQYSPAAFAENGIRLGFLKTGGIKYKQFGHEFVPWLSIIDVMMFNPVREIQKFLKDYTIVPGRLPLNRVETL